MAQSPGTSGGVHPIHGPNKLKLGVFAMNCSNGCTISTAPEAHKVGWDSQLDLAHRAETADFELLVPVGRWKGFGGPTNFNGENFETYTWAAGIGQATKNIGVMTTSHVAQVHPIVAAKQGATIDHISHGRYGLNIVCGYSPAEMGMFGSPIMNHDDRYAYADEWIEIVKRLWTAEAEFDFEGKHLRILRGESMPKPLQTPMPPLMNAGGSPRGRRFAAEHCDIAFVLLKPGDMAGTKAKIDDYRDYARKEFGREIKIWANAYVVHGETQKEADDLLRYYAVERGDDVAVQNLCVELGVDKVMPTPEAYEEFKFHFKAGYGGYPLVGTAETIVETLDQLSQQGLDGLVLSWLEYGPGIDTWAKTINPGLVQAGLRLR